MDNNKNIALEKSLEWISDHISEDSDFVDLCLGFGLTREDLAGFGIQDCNEYNLFDLRGDAVHVALQNWLDFVGSDMTRDIDQESYSFAEVIAEITSGNYRFNRFGDLII